ncbi:hypothetical protein MATL_G00205950 [Megalops atlanticus]|uniref:Cytochrome P450 n=1 Tax=Megalops atlanticus TaxID=7932 RepID=A0A9D3PIA1_MEGAT|nr:hypothetical protein MATL_G00205950 [Megalops atlanticus]
MSLLGILPLNGTSSLFFILTCIIIIYILNLSKTNENFPPGPWPLPLVGNIFSLNMKRPYQTLMELNEKYGSVFSIQMGLRKVVVLCGYETVKEALISQADQFAERPDIPIYQQITKGNGIVFGHGDSWKTIRRFTLTVLRDLGMGKKNIEEKIIEESEHLVNRFEKQNGQPFETRIPLNAATSNIIVSLIMGERMEYEDETFHKLLIMNNESLRLTGTPFIQLYNMYPMIHPLPGPHHKVIQHKEKLKAFFRKIFIQRRELLDENDKRCYIDIFMKKLEEEKSNPSSYFHEWNLLCTVTNLFVAGTETSSNTLSWALLIMIKYPHIQKKVHEEIDNVIGGSTPRIHHRQMMPFTDAVIHETQRFADIIPMNLPHETTTDVTLKGYFIPKHFLNEEGKFVKREAFMPFSAGRRVCVGETLARMELFLFFTFLLQRFSFHPPVGVKEEDIELSSRGGLTLAPVPFLVRALPRRTNT